MAVENRYDLPCGRSLDQVWDHLDTANEHEVTCSHCGTARESLRALRSATVELVAERLEPRRDLTDRIMSAVRAEVRRHGEMLPMRAEEPGELEVSEQAVAVVLRFAADEIDGVRARRCRVQVIDRDSDGETLLYAELTVAVAYRDDIAELLMTLRERLGTACAVSVGLRLTQLDVVVADLYE